MKAIVYSEYGSPGVLRYVDTVKPVPKDHEVLVKIHAASVNPYDWHMMRGKPGFLRLMVGLRRPRDIRLGVDMAGVVEAVSKDVTEFRPGDAVFGVCRGAFAEYGSASVQKLAPKPANVSFEQAAAMPIAAFTALQGLRDAGKIRPGQRVAIDGASGGVGTFAVQLAKTFGAEVTAVCSTGKLDTMRALGADHVVDYTREDFTRDGRRYDLILAANGYHSIFDYRRALAPGGIYVMTGGGGIPMLQAIFLGPLLSLVGGKKLRMKGAKSDKQDLSVLRGLLETGKITPLIDRTYPLSETAEAVRYLEEGHARGKVVLRVAA